MQANDLTGSHLAIIGNSGAGKSYAIRRLLEDRFGQSTHIVFDVEDEFHSLRESHPYVLVNGQYADLRVEVSGAADLARCVVASGTSVIIQLNSMWIERRQEFIAAFVTALLGLPREDWRRCLVVLDEADKYCPQGTRTPSTQPVINLMALGRKRGIVGVLATQRAAKINKSAVSECANWMIGRQVGMNDRRVAAEQLGFTPTGQEMKALPALAPGMFWRTGPAFGERHIAPVPRTATTHLGFGQSFVPGAIAPDLVATLAPQKVVAYVPPVKLADPSRANRWFWRSIIAAGALLVAGHFYGAALMAS